MHLKSVTLRGFKSFADGTLLDFGPGVSVIVGRKGSGKSNVTVAVLWAMGAQSPLAVRGQSMQDVIFGGGRGVKARTAAEVEIVLDNSDSTVDLPLSEISIQRRLDTAGEGEYRLNGARCRLVDVLEVLSDTGLGKETHSVISQGRVESIVSSKPRDRRMLIEEAAGLGKHRKRRRRAQLKLERTQENLDRALDIEREARLRLRPLKRQAEAAELHARLERQTLEVRYELAREALRARRGELEAAAEAARAARAAREVSDARLAEVIARRVEAENELAQRSERRDAIAARVYGARSAAERLDLRAEQLAGRRDGLAQRIARAQADLEVAGESAADAETRLREVAERDRIPNLQEQLAELDAQQEAELERELAELVQARERAAEAAVALQQDLDSRRTERTGADEAAEHARARLRTAERELEAARREVRGFVGAELAAVNQFLRGHTGAPGGARALRDELQVQAGFELALAAVLGGRLTSALVSDLQAAQALLARAGSDGGSALVVDLDGDGSAAATGAGEQAPDQAGGNGSAPVPGARRLLDLVSGPPAVLALAARLLEGAWLVERLEDLPAGFAGIAVTRNGRVWTASPGRAGGLGAWGELRQVAPGGAERVLSQRNERERLVAVVEATAQAQIEVRAAVDAAAAAVSAADEARDAADRALRDADRRRAEAAETQRRSEWLIEQRRRAPTQGPLAVRRAQIEGELAAERRQAELLERERVQREARLERLRRQLRADQALDAAGGPSRARRRGRQRRGRRAHGRARGPARGRPSGRRGRGGHAARVRCRRSRDPGNAARAGRGGDPRRGRRAAPARPRAGGRGRARRGRVGARAAGAAARAAARRGRSGRASQRAWSGWLGGASRSVRSTRWPRTSTARRSSTCASWRSAAAIWRPRCASCGRSSATPTARSSAPSRRPSRRRRPTSRSSSGTSSRAAAGACAWSRTTRGRARCSAARRSPHSRPTASPTASPTVRSTNRARTMPPPRRSPRTCSASKIEVTPAGKSTKRLSLLSGGEKAMTALAFLFAVFLARPCPFYILDEVEAALDDANLDRFLTLLRRYGNRTQFVVITHQKRTMEAADWLYGVSMSGDGVSKVISRRLPSAEGEPHAVPEPEREPEPEPAELAS